jgi:hypothetical protein
MKVTLTPAQIDDLREIFFEHGVIEDENEFRTDYSGRGMYGDTCLAITTNGSAGLETGLMMAMAIAEYNVDNEDREDFEPILIDWFFDGRTDSMGLGMVHYWPRLTAE